MKILVVDDERDIRDFITLFLESHFNAKIYEVPSGNSAIAVLKNQNDIQCVISDYSMSDGSGGDVLKYIRSAGLKVPFVLCSAYDHRELVSLFPQSDVAAYIQKPNVIEPLKKVIEGLMLPEGEVFSEGGVEYSPVRLRTLNKLGVLPFDLYLMLVRGKFIKVAKGGNSFDESELKRYDEKNIEHFYIRRSDSPLLMDRLAEKINQIVEGELTSDRQIQEFTTSAIELLNRMKPMVSFPEQAQTLIQKSAQATLKTIRQNRRLDEIFTETIENSSSRYISTHGVAIAHLACGIAAQMGWVSDSTFFKLTLAAFCHDLTLSNDALAMQRSMGDLSLHGENFSKEEIAAFATHPDDMAQLLLQMTGVPPEVATIVAQHHERPDGSGFPQQLEAQSIDSLAAVSIIAHELYTYFSENGSDQGLKPFVQSLGNEFQRGVFGQILGVLLKSQSSTPAR